MQRRLRIFTFIILLPLCVWFVLLMAHIHRGVPTDGVAAQQHGHPNG